MKFTKESTSSLTIQRVSRNTITVGGETYERPISLTPDEAVAPWEAGPVTELVESHFDELLAAAPELVLLGTGSAGVFPPRDLVFAFARRGIGFETMDTAAAARTFNVLATEGRRIAAVLYLED